IYPKDLIKIKNIGIDYSKFKKEKTWGNLKNEYVYHDKASGIAIIVRNDYVSGIIFTPAAQNHPRLCDRKKDEGYSPRKKWKSYEWMKRANFNFNIPVNVTRLDLSRD